MYKWQAVVFDLDDTLYPERDYVLSGFRAVAVWADEHLGIPADQGFDELRGLYEQGVRGNTFNRWLEVHLLASKGVVADLVRVYREHEPALVPFPEVPTLLEALRSRCLLGLVSDGYRQVQERKLEALDLAHCFDAVVFSDEWGRDAWKPSTKPFEIVVQRLGVVAEQAVYVGDNPMKDFLGAGQIGLRTVRVRRASGEYAHLEPPSEQHRPDICIGSLSELDQALVWLEDET